MNSFHKNTAGLLVAALLLGVLGRTSMAKKPPKPDPPPTPVEYEIRWLGYSDPTEHVEPYAINDNGVVVGEVGRWIDGYRAFVAYTDTVLELTTEADVPVGWMAKSAASINNLGQIAGAVQDLTTGEIVAAIYDLGTRTTVLLETVGAGDHYAVDINPSGEIVGYRIDPDEGYVTIVYTWNDDSRGYEGQEIGPGRALTINDSGEILTDTCRIYYLANGSWVRLSQLTACGDMNDVGEVAGRAVVKIKGKQQYEGAVRLDSSNNMKVLFDGQSQYETGSAINNAGQVLIDYTMSRDGLILYDDTHGALRLFDLVVGDPSDVAFFSDGYGFKVRRGLSEPDATGFGKICGNMTIAGRDSERFAFVLTPKAP